MAFRIIAGPALSESAFHCATVGAGWALAETERINAAHWKAAEDGKQVYRLPDVTLVESDSGGVSAQVAQKSVPSDAGGVSAQSGQKSPALIIPDDLTIPDFLRRLLAPMSEHPIPELRAAA